MSNWASVLPITALVAVLIFACKEVLEFIRRRSGDRRKLQALKALVARECELNLWTIKNLRQIFADVHSAANESTQIRVEILSTPSGRPFARVVSEDDGAESHTGIPKTHRELMSKFLLDIATLDKKLFEVMEPAYDGLAEIEHIRGLLLNVGDAPDFLGPSGYLEGLAGYALDEIKEAEDALNSLYMHCTGKALTKHRLR